MKNYYRIMLGKGSTESANCFAGGFVGVNFGIAQDLTGKLPDEWREFNREFIPVFLAARPDKTKIAAGLACGSLWTIGKGIMSGDLVLSPDGNGRYRVGEITGDYFYVPGPVLPHRRRVSWSTRLIDRAEMSESLRNSAGSIGTIGSISGHRDEIEKLIGESLTPTIVSTDSTVEDPAAFAMEKHLEDFLVEN